MKFKIEEISGRVSLIEVVRNNFEVNSLTLESIEELKDLKTVIDNYLSKVSLQ